MFMYRPGIDVTYFWIYGYEARALDPFTPLARRAVSHSKNRTPSLLRQVGVVRRLSPEQPARTRYASPPVNNQSVNSGIFAAARRFRHPCLITSELWNCLPP